MNFLLELGRDIGQRLLRLAIPLASLAIFFQGYALGWLRDPSWIPLLLGLLLVPVLLVQRRRVDALSAGVALLAGGAAFALSGLTAGVVIALGWLIPACLSGRFLDILGEAAPT